MRVGSMHESCLAIGIGADGIRRDFLVISDVLILSYWLPLVRVLDQIHGIK